MPGSSNVTRAECPSLDTAAASTLSTPFVCSRRDVTSATALLNWFPYAHFELQIMGRLQFPTGGDAAKTLFIHLHYFL